MINKNEIAGEIVSELQIVNTLKILELVGNRVISISDIVKDNLEASVNQYLRYKMGIK